MNITDKQLQENYDAYVNELQEEMERTHFGKTLLMHVRKVIDLFEDRGMAYVSGYEKYGLGKFTLVTVGDAAISTSVLCRLRSHSRHATSKYQIVENQILLLRRSLYHPTVRRVTRSRLWSIRALRSR